MDAERARKGTNQGSVSDGVIFYADVRSLFYSTGCRCLRNVFNRESEINTHARQSNMPIFS